VHFDGTLYHTYDAEVHIWRSRILTRTSASHMQTTVEGRVHIVLTVYDAVVKLGNRPEAF